MAPQPDINKNLQQAINDGNSDKLRKILTPNTFTTDYIDNSIVELKRKRDSAILDTNNTISDETFNKMIEILSNYNKSQILYTKLPTDMLGEVQSFLGGKKKSKKQRRLGKKKTAKRRKRNTIKRRKMKGGDKEVCNTETRSKCGCEERFVQLKEEGNDDNCTLCQGSLKGKIDELTPIEITKQEEENRGKPLTTEQLKKHQVIGSIIYQIGCGHRFHAYCLHTYCKTPTSKTSLGDENNKSLSCPICKRNCINRDTEEVVDSFAGNAGIMGLSNGEQYLTPEYTGRTD
jgi:hypothetical protein